MPASNNSSPWVSPAETASPESIAFHQGSDTDKVFVQQTTEHGLFTVEHDRTIPAYADTKQSYHGIPTPAPVVEKVKGVQISQVEKEAASDDEKSTKSRPIWRWIILGVALLVIIGLSIGLGMGLTIGKPSSSDAPTTSQQSTDSATPTSSGIGTATGAPSKMASILANSSLTAVESELGDRFVFFQAEDNTIRWTIYTNSTSQWSSVYTLNNGIKARTGTPMAAYVQPGSNVAAQSLIELVYISDNSSIVEVEIGAENHLRSGLATDSRPLIAADDAEYLTISASMRPGANTTMDLFMMFRTSSSVGVWQREIDRTDWTFGTPWQDITSDLTDSLAGAKICEPFTANAFFSTTAADGQPDTLAQFVSSSCSQASPRVMSSIWNRLNNTFTTATWSTWSFDNQSTTSNVQNNPSITKSDWVVVQGSSEWYFVNANKALSAFSFQNTALIQPVMNMAFPYRHLSSLRYAWGLRSSFLYSQLDKTTFAEHIYSPTSKVWQSTVVDVTKITPASS